MGIREDLYQKRLFFDGGMGTLLQERGLGPGEQPEPWSITHPQVIRDIHRCYLESGADIITCNMFGANRFKMAHTPYSVEQVVTASVGLAKEVIAASGKRAYAAIDLGPTGKLFEPYGDLEFDQAVEVFGEMVRAGVKAGGDLVLIETMSDTMEVKAALLAAKENSDLPVFVTMTFDEKGKLLMGADIRTAITIAESLGADAVGMNCGLGPHQFRKLVPQLLECASVPVILNPNAGLPISVNGKTVFTVGPQEFAQLMAGMAARGVQIVGGCCGTTPEHLAALVEACRDIPYQKPQPKEVTAVSSYRMTVEFGHRPLMIGERLNPTGKSKLKKALREGDMDYLVEEALAQTDAGADILDVNVGVPGLDEASVMDQVVRELQTVVIVPLQIDTAHVEAMERALRHYNGKPLLNSVSGKEESMSQVFPLVKKYGAAVVALTLDEEGIPSTAQGRLAVAEKIIRRAADYGISKKDIIVDPLTMTVSTGADNARITLEALSLIREKLGVHTVLGVSNISFGLPRRGLINTAFFTMALDHGLSAGIINPANQEMQDALYASWLLRGEEDSCEAFLRRYGEQPEGNAVLPDGGELNLRDAIVAGLKNQSYQLAKQLAEEMEPLAVVDGYLVPALDQVGQGFEKGKVFLPQLLMSAEAAKGAFTALREVMEERGSTGKSKGVIVLATVKGDVHDIGKNIVRALLENYGYTIVDLGKDVDPQAVCRAAGENQVKLVGLSALMTTTVAAMEETIRLLRDQLPQVQVMVGGAVLTQEYANQIGADYYAKDAMQAVEIAGKVYC